MDTVLPPPPPVSLIGVLTTADKWLTQQQNNLSLSVALAVIDDARSLT